MKIQALILAPAPNIKMVLFCLHFFTSQLSLSEALLRLVAVPDATNYLLSRALIIHFCLVYFTQRAPHRAKARPTRTLNNPKGLLGFCAAVVER